MSLGCTLLLLEAVAVAVQVITLVTAEAVEVAEFGWDGFQQPLFVLLEQVVLQVAITRKAVLVA
jgi:hypothetical protein